MTRHRAGNCFRRGACPSVVSRRAATVERGFAGLRAALLGVGLAALVTVMAAGASGQSPPAKPLSERAAASRARARELGDATGPGAAASVPPLLELLRDGHSEVRAEASRSLMRLAPPAGDAVRPLANAALAAARQDEAEERAEHQRALARYGAEALAPLREMMRGADTEEALAAALAVESLVAHAAPLVPELTALTLSDEPGLRFAGLNGLMHLKAEAAGAAEAVGKLLSHEDFHTRYWACKALGEMGPAARGSVGKLIELLRNDNASVRRHAARALGRLGPELGGRPAVDALTDAVSDPLHPVRLEALIALRLYAPLSSTSRETVETFLSDPRKLAARAAAAETLYQFAPDSPLIPEVLMEELVRLQNAPWAAAEVLGRIGVKLKLVAPVVEVLKSEDPLIRQCAADALGAMGPEARSAAPALEALAKSDPDPDARAAAADALAKVSGR